MQKWEIGQKHPTVAALKLLHLVQKNEIDIAAQERRRLAVDKKEKTNPDDHLRTTSRNLWSSKNIWEQDEVLCRDSLQEAQDKFDYMDSSILYIHPDEFNDSTQSDENFRLASRIWADLVFLLYRGGPHTLRLLKNHYRSSFNPDQRERAVKLTLKIASYCKGSTHEYRILFESIIDDLKTISLMDRNSEVRATAFSGYLDLVDAPRDAELLIADMLCHDIVCSQRALYLSWPKVQELIKDRDVGFSVWNSAKILLDPRNTPQPLTDAERAGLIRVMNACVRQHHKHKAETGNIVETYRKFDNHLIKLAIEDFDSIP